MDRLELYKEIEDYLKNRLSKEERAAFQIRIQEDAELAAEVELHRAIIQANTEQEVRAFRNQMVSILTEESSTDKTAPLQVVDKSQTPLGHTTLSAVRGSWRWLVAASILIALGIWLFRPKTSQIDPPIVNNQQKDTTISKRENIVENNNANPIDSETIETPQPRNQKRPTNKPKIAPNKTQSQYIALAEAEYQFYPGGIRSAEDQDTVALSNLEKAKIYYAEAKWEQVIRLLQNPDEDQRTEALKLRAHAYFQLKQFNKAAVDFELIKTSDEEWNLLLCYLAQLPKKQFEFDKLLNQISTDPNHSFASKARELSAKVQQK